MLTVLRRVRDDALLRILGVGVPAESRAGSRSERDDGGRKLLGAAMDDGFVGVCEVVCRGLLMGKTGRGRSGAGPFEGLAEAGRGMVVAMAGGRAQATCSVQTRV